MVNSDWLEQMKRIAIIPARSGSKGLPNKNVLSLNGKPLMAYTIQAAIDSKMFSEVMVSTDSEEYASIAKKFGASVPFLRSCGASSDKAGSWDVVREVLQQYINMGVFFDEIALLQPTSPLRNSEDIINAFEQKRKLHSNCVVSVVEVEHPVQWCFELSENRSMDEFANSSYCYMRRQDLPKHYRENGAIYIVNADKICSDDYNLYADNCTAYIMDNSHSVDIDSKEDFLIADALLRNNI